MNELNKGIVIIRAVVSIGHGLVNLPFQLICSIEHCSVLTVYVEFLLLANCLETWRLGTHLSGGREGISWVQQQQSMATYFAPEGSLGEDITPGQVHVSITRPGQLIGKCAY